MTVLKANANRAKMVGDPLRGVVDLVQRGAACRKCTCDLVD